MGFFFSEPDSYNVVKIGNWFVDDQVVLEYVTIEEAEDFIKRRSGWFSGDGNTYKIVKNRL